MDNDESKTLDPRFECPICLSWLKDPLLTSCGHRFCSQCIHDWLAREGARCPVDNRPLRSSKDLFRDLYTKREIFQQQKIYEDNKQLECTLESLDINMKPGADQGTKKSFDEHQECSDTTDNGLNNQDDTEDEIVTNIQKISLDDDGVDRTFTKLETGKTTGKSGIVHEELETDWQKLVKQLYERIVMLEQQNRELSIALENQNITITSLQNQTHSNHEEISRRNCHGMFIWRLNSFSQQFTDIKNDPLKMIYSPGFYTNPNGYKICARINVSSKNTNYLSIVLHIMQSENDDALDWPFSGQIYFTLIHPTVTEKSVREIASSSPDLEAFRRPVCTLNKRSFGYTEFLPLSDVEEFLHNDQLIFRIEVKTTFPRG